MPLIVTVPPASARLFSKSKEGDKVKIADVRFVGNAHVKARALKGEMETKKWWMFSWLTGSGRFKDDQFDDDLEKLPGLLP